MKQAIVRNLSLQDMKFATGFYTGPLGKSLIAKQQSGRAREITPEEHAAFEQFQASPGGNSVGLKMGAAQNEFRSSSGPMIVGFVADLQRASPPKH